MDNSPRVPQNVSFSFYITDSADLNTGFRGWARLCYFDSKTKRLHFLLMRLFLLLA